MQTVRFFEDRNGPGGARRLMVGIASCDEAWAVDGGRREAVKVATTEDAQDYAAAYAAYYESFAAAGAEHGGAVAPEHAGMGSSRDA
jgi:hypothetical protein